VTSAGLVFSVTMASIPPPPPPSNTVYHCRSAGFHPIAIGLLLDTLNSCLAADALESHPPWTGSGDRKLLNAPRDHKPAPIHQPTDSTADPAAPRGCDESRRTAMILAKLSVRHESGGHVRRGPPRRTPTRYADFTNHFTATASTSPGG